jgi:inner membrane protein
LDNLTHSLVGWTLGQAGLKSKTRKGLAALILGANMPDIDVFLGHAPWDPLAIHRGFTHGLPGGVLFLPPLLAGLLWLLDRWQLSRAAEFKSGLPMRFGWLVVLAYLGTLTHPFLDLLTTYSVQLFSPLSSAWYHADALFIIDVWVWLLLAVAIGVSKRRERRGLEWRRVPQIAIVVLLAYIGANLAISQVADARVRSIDPKSEAIFASPPPVLSWRRDMVWRDGDNYCRASFDPLGMGFRLGSCAPSNMGNPLVRETTRRDPRLQKFLKWSILPQAAVSKDRCAVRVSIGDERYGEGRRSRLARETVIPTGANGCSLDKRSTNS